MSTTRKELFKIFTDLIGSSGSSSLPDLPKHELPDAYADFFWQQNLLILLIMTAPFAVNHWPSSTWPQTSETEVWETILKCPPKHTKADPIKTSLLTETIGEIVPPLAKLFNASLSSGIVPSAFKEAKVKTAIDESGSQPSHFQIYYFSRKYLRKSCLLIWANILLTTASWILCSQVTVQTDSRKLCSLLGRPRKGFSAGLVRSVLSIWYYTLWGFAEATASHTGYWRNSFEVVPLIYLWAFLVCTFL